MKALFSDPNQLRRRIERLDRLEARLLSGSPRAIALQSANQRVYETIRADIQRGDGRNSLLHWLSPSSEAPSDRDGYDYLDEIIAGVFQFAEPGPALVEPTPDMVVYQPTPVRHILDLFDKADLVNDDVFVDLGSGLGHVTLLAAILRDVQSIGIEIEPAYIECARQTADGLHIKNVTFLQQDARTIDLQNGTVFYLYTPFTGNMLCTMLDRLRHEARGRLLRICSYGPCTATIAAEPWLESASPPHPGRITLFHSRP